MVGNDHGPLLTHSPFQTVGVKSESAPDRFSRIWRTGRAARDAL
jgi:hypothetical protein